MADKPTRQELLEMLAQMVRATSNLVTGGTCAPDIAVRNAARVMVDRANNRCPHCGQEKTKGGQDDGNT